MPKLVVVERDYGAIAEQDGRARPAGRHARHHRQGRHRRRPRPRSSYLRAQERRGPRRGRATGARRWPATSHACEAILALSGTTNGRVAIAGVPAALEQRTGQQLADLAAEHEGKQITFADTQARPVPVITSPEWSGSEHGGRRYSPFTINVERLKPWHTLTGRQHFFLDHDWMHELGRGSCRSSGRRWTCTGSSASRGSGETGELELTVRYLTPHSKWSIHSEYQDNLFMLTLSRGGPTIWMSEAGTPRRSASGTTTGSRRSTATASSSARAVVIAPDARGHRLHVPRPGPA